MSLQDRVVLITGATGVLGGAVAHALATTGARLALHGRRAADLEPLVADLSLPPERVLIVTADLTRNEEVQALVGAIAAHWGGVDVLLNTVGGWAGGKRLAETTDEDWERMLNLNLRTAILINRAVLPHMVEQGWGRIVNVGSSSALEPRPRQAPSNVAKAGVVALTRSISEDYRRQGITANVILPSTMDTPDNRANMPDADTSRWATPDEVAAMMRFLASEEASGVTGATIAVFGRV